MSSTDTDAPKRLLIAGLPRCGTTLLATFLASQPRVSFLTDYVTSFTGAATRLRVADWRDPLDRTQRRIALAIVRDELLRYRHPVLVGVDEFTSIRELHEAVLAELTRPGDRVVGHKLVLTDEQVGRILEETASHVVVLYRDPRDAALSYFHRMGSGVEAYLESWRRMVRRVIGEPHPRLFALRYESLVSTPEATLRPLFDALGLRLDIGHAALVFDRGAAGAIPWPGNASFEERARPFDSHALERWRRATESPIVRYAGWACRREVRELGYPEGPPMRLLEASRWRAHRAAHALVERVDRGWERGRESILSLAAPSLDGSDPPGTPKRHELDKPPTSHE